MQTRGDERGLVGLGEGGLEIEGICFSILLIKTQLRGAEAEQGGRGLSSKGERRGKRDIPIWSTGGEGEGLGSELSENGGTVSFKANSSRNQF